MLSFLRYRSKRQALISRLPACFKRLHLQQIKLIFSLLNFITTFPVFMFFFITEATESNSFITFVISQIKDRNAGLSGHKYTANNTIRRERGTVSNKYGEAQVSLQFGSNECNYQTLLVQGVVARERGGEGLRDPGILLTHSSP